MKPEKPAPVIRITGHVVETDDGHEVGLRVSPGGLDLSSRYLVHADGRRIRVNVVPSSASEQVWDDIAAEVTALRGLGPTGVAFLEQAADCLEGTWAMSVARLRKRLAKRGWRAAGEVDFGATWEPQPWYMTLSRLETAELKFASHLHAVAWTLSRCGVLQPASMASFEWLDVPDVMFTRASRFARHVVGELPVNVSVLVASELVAGELVRAFLRDGFQLDSTQWRRIAIG